MANRKFGNKNLYQWLIERVAEHGSSKECLIWTHCTSKQGYGTLALPGGIKIVLAHRVAFLITHGRWPTDKALHTCDNPSCFNPNHIVEGSQSDNIADMEAKGRSVHVAGERQGLATVTDEQAREIVLRYDGRNGTALAEEYGTKQSVISKIVLRKTFASATCALPVPVRISQGKGFHGGESHPLAKMTWELVDQLRSDTHLSNVQLASKYGITRSTARKIRNNLLWKR